MNHTPTIARGLITCDACAFRAVLATDGRVLITELGDASADHLALVRAQQAERDQQAARVMDRLKTAYAERRITPAGAVLSLNQLQRLYRAVLGEFAL